MHLVDTNVISEFLRPRPDRAVLSWASEQPSFLISVITLEEIWYGLEAKRSVRLEQRLERFLQDFCEMLPVSPSIARRCAHLRAGAKVKGTPRTQADMLIAATAHEHDAILVTRNTRDFTDCGVRLLNPFSA